MKSIVIGSSGFIGTHLVERLKKEGHEVEELHHNEEFSITSADYIFYLASYGNHYKQKDQFQTVKANILDYIGLLGQVATVDFKGLIHFSTSSVTLPIQTNYSETKAIAEYYTKRVFHKKHKPLISIRPYSVYGPGEDKNRFIPTIINKIKTGKTIKLTNGSHDWIYIDDFMDALMLVVKNIKDLVGKTTPIGTGKQYQNMEIVNKLFRIAGKEVKITKTLQVSRSYDTDNWCADTTIMEGLGWKPKYSIEEGLEATYKSYE